MSSIVEKLQGIAGTFTSVLAKYQHWEIAVYTVLLFVLYILGQVMSKAIKRAWVYFIDGELTIERVEPHLNGVIYPVSYWTERGGRPYQEDRFNAIKAQGDPDTSLYGVFDGHGGYLASQHCKQYLLQSIASDPELSKNPSKTIAGCFRRVDEDFSAKARAQMFNDGSTAVVGVIGKEKIYVANAGDSRAIIVQKGGKVKPMSLDHRPERKDEESRIRKLGGKLIYWGRWRVEGVLSVSRSIGDVSLQPFVTAEPEIIEKVIEPEDEYMVIASDGLWDVMENEYVAKMVLSSSKQFLEIAKTLCTEAVILGSQDNVTVLVVDIKKRPVVIAEAKAK